MRVGGGKASQSDFGQIVLGNRAPGLAVNVAHLQAKGHIVQHRAPGEERIFLKDHCGERVRLSVNRCDVDRAVVIVTDARHHAQQG